MKHYKRYKHMANQHQTCAKAREKRVRHAHAVMCEHCVRHENAAQMALSIQHPQEERVKEREVDPVAPLLPLSRGVWISRIVVVCVVTLVLGASLLFLSATPYTAKSASMAEVLAPIRHLSLWHMWQ